MPKKVTTIDWIAKARKIHRNKYDYSKVIYTSARDKVIIYCRVCNKYFEQIASYHHQGKGCSKCNPRGTHTQKSFIKAAKRVHGNKFDYSETKFIGMANKVKIICKVHGLFEQRANVHINQKSGCPKCYFDKYRYDTQDWIKKAHKIHNNVYDYKKVKYVNRSTKITIICPKHGEFKQEPGAHLFGSGCPKCNSSRGEKTIIRLLEHNNIPYKHQFCFKDCTYIRRLWYDFALFNNNGDKQPLAIIEYQGGHHFDKTHPWYSKDVRFRDKVKKKYCKKVNIPLFEIREDEIIGKSLKKIVKIVGLI